MSGTDMDPEPSPPPLQWRWTAKGPALILSLTLALAGFLALRGHWRWSLPAAAVLLATSFLTLVYSTTVHGWCAPAGHMAFGQEWGSAFWHGPSAWDCWHLVNPATPKGR